MRQQATFSNEKRSWTKRLDFDKNVLIKVSSWESNEQEISIDEGNGLGPNMNMLQAITWTNTPRSMAS